MYHVMVINNFQVLPKYNILIQANQCHFDVYDENGDGIITLEEMTSLFKDKELGANLFYDLHISKGKSTFNMFALA